MAKYIVDIDSLMGCLDLISEGKMVRDNNEFDWTYLQNVKVLINRFPKDKVEETISIEVKNNVEIKE